MTCVELERELEELDDYSVCSAEMTAHLGACRVCSELIEDLTEIQEQAAHMLSVAEPSNQLWIQIRDRLTDEGVIRDGSKQSWFRRLGMGWLSPLRMGASYALVFFFGLGGVYVYSVFSPTIPPPSIAVVQAPAPQAEKLMQNAAPASRAMYVSNLEQVDSSIQQLQTFLASHPDDQFAQDQLSTIYQQKSRLWEDMVRWQDQTSEQLQLNEDLP